MSIKPVYAVLAVVFVAIVVVVTALLVPAQVPAYETAVEFVRDAGKGKPDAALAALSPEMQAWVASHCRDSSVTACVDDYTPPQWGNMLSAVFRRAQPAGADAFDVQVIATYEDNQGFSGVCIYLHVMQQDDHWEITRWTGWNSCDDPNGGMSAMLSDPNAPNRAP